MDGGVAGERDERRRQANRDKRLAKRKRAQSDREELVRLRNSTGSAKGSSLNGKGKVKGSGKDQAKEEICYSWAKGSGPCAGPRLEANVNVTSNACANACPVSHRGTTICSAQSSDFDLRWENLFGASPLRE